MQGGLRLTPAADPQGTLRFLLLQLEALWVQSFSTGEASSRSHPETPLSEARSERPAGTERSPRLGRDHCPRSSGEGRPAGKQGAQENIFVTQTLHWVCPGRRFSPVSWVSGQVHWPGAGLGWGPRWVSLAPPPELPPDGWSCLVQEHSPRPEDKGLLTSHSSHGGPGAIQRALHRDGAPGQRPRCL